MFQTYVEQPVFNLLEFIYAIIPGHDLGLSIIIFTVVIRLALWPLVKRQLHQSRAMKKLQPKLKDIKKEAGGDRQKQARLQMELYKEHGIKPFATIGTLIVQIPIFIALFFSIRKLIEDPNILFNFAYEPVRNMAWIQTLAADMAQFQHSLLGVVDLSRSGTEGFYVPAILLAIAATVVQYYQSKMLMTDTGDAKKLSEILRDAAEGKEADQSDVSAAVGRSMLYFLPFITFIFAVAVPSALALYLLTSAAVGYAQQAYVLKQDEEEMEELADEAVEIEQEAKESAARQAKPKKKKKKSSKKSKKRRK